MFRKFIIIANCKCSTKRNQFIHRILCSLSDNSDVKICKFDKGKGVSVLNSNDYISKLNSIVNDKSKFIEVKIGNSHPIIPKEKAINYYIRTYLKEFGEEIVKSLLSSGTNPGKLYELVKVHENGNSIRPVVSMINSPEYKLAKFLDSLIKPYMPEAKMIQSTDEFLDKIKNFQCNPNQMLVSFDVVSLFTNVPLTETIEIIAEKIFSKGNGDTPPIRKDIFIKLMHLATEGFFTFNDKLYKQIDGVAMGSPLGPTLANFFLGNLENSVFEHSSPSHPKISLC